MHAAKPGPSRDAGRAMHGQTDVLLQRIPHAQRQSDLLVLRQILLAQAHPAAAAGDRCTDDGNEVSSRLPAIGDEQ